MKNILVLKENTTRLTEPINNCGVFNPKESELPSIGGSGVNQSIQINDAFILSKDIIVGKQQIPAYTLLVSKVNNPSQDINNWILIDEGAFNRQNIDEYISPSIFTKIKNCINKIF